MSSNALSINISDTPLILPNYPLKSAYKFNVYSKSLPKSIFYNNKLIILAKLFYSSLLIVFLLFKFDNNFTIECTAIESVIFSFGSLFIIILIKSLQTIFFISSGKNYIHVTNVSIYNISYISYAS